VKYYRDQELIDKIGLRVKELRKARNISQFKLALETGFEVRVIKRIENGEVNASISHIGAIAQAFQITLSDFFEFDQAALTLLKS
jgi:transcriptional regulator with XRE-family HTH domain